MSYSLTTGSLTLSFESHDELNAFVGLVEKHSSKPKPKVKAPKEDGVKKSKWTKADEKKLVRLYNTMSSKDLACKLNRTVFATGFKISQLRKLGKIGKLTRRFR